jgi:hypothetical protein
MTACLTDSDEAFQMDVEAAVKAPRMIGDMPDGRIALATSPRLSGTGIGKCRFGAGTKAFTRFQSMAACSSLDTNCYLKLMKP